MILEDSIENLASLEERLISNGRFGIALIDTHIFKNAFSMCLGQEYIVDDLRRRGFGGINLEYATKVRLSQSAYAQVLLQEFLPKRVDGQVFIGASTDFIIQELYHVFRNYPPRISKEYSEWKTSMAQADEPYFVSIKTDYTNMLLSDWPTFIGTLSPYQLKLLVFQNKLQDSRNSSDSSKIDKGLLMLAAQINENTGLQVEIITENLRDFKEKGTEGPPQGDRTLIHVRTPKEFIMNYSRRN